MFIEKLREKFGNNEPIFTNEILKLFDEFTYVYVFRLISKAKDMGELIQFDNGVYYIPEKTVFGLSTITSDDVINKKYIQDGKDIFGVYSGLKLQNIFSVTTQMPNTVEVVTNNETTRCRKIEIDGRSFILRKSRCHISKENSDAYMVLQLFNDLGTQIKLDNFAKEKIIGFIRKNNVSTSDIVNLARVFPAKTTKNLIVNGILNETA